MIGRLVAALVVGITGLAPYAAAEAPRGQDKTVICHRTASPANPYNQVVVANESALEGHASHRGPVYELGLDQWGDIIPPIRPGLPLGRNWPAGKKIWNNGCEVPPDVGSVPSGTIGSVTCAPTGAAAQVTVANAANATQPALFDVVVNGTVVRQVGPVAPGESQTVTLSSGLVEDQTVTIEVRSDGEVVTSEVVTIDCVAVSPQVVVRGRVTCTGDVAYSSVAARNNGTRAVSVTAIVNGTPVGGVVVGPGEQVERSFSLAAYEDETVVAELLVDGATYGTYTVTPDCLAAVPRPKAGFHLGCRPSVAVVRLTNAGDPESWVRFTISVNGRVVQRSARIYGGTTTTIVKPVSRYEDKAARVVIRADGRVVEARRVVVNCQRTSPIVGGPS